MNTLICAGGSGSRVLEAILHLCAAGLGPKSLRILMIDPDAANGNAAQAEGLLETYLQCHQMCAGKLGTGLDLFGTELDLFDTDGEKQGLKKWFSVQPKEKLADLLNYDSLSKTQCDVAHLFFTQKELKMELDQGFRGHAAIGAAAMSLISLDEGRQPWKQVIEKLNGDIALPAGAQVFLVGSVFGGTGASAIHPVARFLRKVPEANPDRLKIGVAALVPYFRFEASTVAAGSTPAEMAVRWEWFPLASRSAAEFYQHLRTNNDWPFDAIYWIGDNSPMEVSYAPGGPDQKNPAHFVDLLAAFSCLEFFRDPVTAKACYYSGPRRDREAQLGNQNILDWPDLPLRHFPGKDVQHKLLRFFLAGVVHLGFCDALLRRSDIDRRPFCVPWYLERFALKRDRLGSTENQRSLDLLTQYFKVYHFPWWSQIHQQETVRLFNRTAIPEKDDGSIDVELNRLANLRWPDNPGEASLDRFDDFFTAMVQVPKAKGGEKGGAAYLALLAHAADRYIGREYDKAESLEDHHA